MKKHRFFIALFIIILNTKVYCQMDTTLFYAADGSITRPEYAEKCISTHHKNKKIILTEFKKTRENEWERTDRNIIKKKSDSVYVYTINSYDYYDYSPSKALVQQNEESSFYLKEYNHDNDLIHEGSYSLVFPKIKHGLMIDYYNNGMKRAESYYENNKLLWSEKWLLNGNKGMDNVYSIVDEEPTYNNRDVNEFRKAMMADLRRYQITSRINGTVIVEFVIMEDGSLKELQILQSNSQELMDEVIRVIMKTDGEWEPAKINGAKVRVIKQFMINFISMSN